MKKLTYIGLATLMLGVGVLGSGCFGQFALTRKVYTWNDSLGNKFVKTIVFWAFVIIPVYGVASFIDAVILNLIEFWSGSNPVSMKPGEKETQIVMKDGVKYEITATQNRFDIKQLDGAKAGHAVAMVYSPADASWSYVDQNNEIKLFSYAGNDMLKIYRPDGSSFMMPADMQNSAIAKANLEMKTVPVFASK